MATFFFKLDLEGEQMATMGLIDLYDKVNVLKDGRGSLAEVAFGLIGVSGLEISDKIKIFGFLITNKLDAALGVMVDAMDNGFIVTESEISLTQDMGVGKGLDAPARKNGEDAQAPASNAFGMRDAMFHFHLSQSDMAACGGELAYPHIAVISAGNGSSSTLKDLLAPTDQDKSRTM